MTRNLKPPGTALERDRPHRYRVHPALRKSTADKAPRGTRHRKKVPDQISAAPIGRGAFAVYRGCFGSFTVQFQPISWLRMVSAYDASRSSIPGRAMAVPASLAVSSRQKFAGSQKPLFMFMALTTWLATMSPPE